MSGEWIVRGVNGAIMDVRSAVRIQVTWDESFDLSDPQSLPLQNEDKKTHLWGFWELSHIMTGSPPTQNRAPFNVVLCFLGEEPQDASLVLSSSFGTETLMGFVIKTLETPTDCMRHPETTPPIRTKGIKW